jgi:hypothetical protein
VVVIATLMGWNYLVNALSYRVRFIERLVSSPSLQVVRDGHSSGATCGANSLPKRS